MAEVLCEKVGPGMRPSERTVAVKDVFGQREFLRVEHDFLTAVGERYFLPVGVVQEDREKDLVLIELPQEGECGGWRLWVHASDLLPANGSPR
jgi:hypothetical protein